MIRVIAIEDSTDNEGGLTLVINGHASEKVCAGSSALWHALTDGYKRMALEYPSQVQFQYIEKKKQSTRR